MNGRPNATPRLLKSCAVILLALVATYASSWASVLAFAWFWFIWFVVLLYFGFTARGSLSKAVLINVGAAVLALALGEIYF